MIDHTGLKISDPVASRRFYEAALAPLGYRVLMEVPAEFTGGMVVLGYGVPPKPDFWVAQGKPEEPRVHVAFRADSRAGVDAFYRAALAAGGRDNGPPGPRPRYHRDYYGAFVLDPDGHNVEAVCHTPA
jgi:catechol 2,3-dioxygenase-like lactoylglutathione lyase family enzyme